MECNPNSLSEESLLGRIGHHVLRAGHLAVFGNIEDAEKEMQQAIDLLHPIFMHVIPPAFADGSFKHSNP